MRLGYITEDTLLEFLGKQHGTPIINLFKETIDPRIIHIIPRDVAEKYKAIAVGFKLERRIQKLIVAMANPSDLEIIDILQFLTGYSIIPIFTREEHFKWLLRHYYR